MCRLSYSSAVLDWLSAAKRRRRRMRSSGERNRAVAGQSNTIHQQKQPTSMVARPSSYGSVSAVRTWACHVTYNEDPCPTCFTTDILHLCNRSGQQTTERASQSGSREECGCPDTQLRALVPARQVVVDTYDITVSNLVSTTVRYSVFYLPGKSPASARPKNHRQASSPA